MSLPIEHTSLIVIHYNRKDHLINLLEGLNQNVLLPSEVILVEYGEKTKLKRKYNFKLKQVLTGLNPNGEINAARGRNLGASVASHENLLFLDVDCIPSTAYILRTIKYLSEKGGVVMGTPLYLTQKVPSRFVELQLFKHSVFHPHRPKIVGVRKEKSYGMFWSLCFAVTKTQFQRLKGFDKSYSGYGGEDTDFAFKMRAQGVDLHLCDAIVYHQMHDFYSPPLNNISSIVSNCNLFYTKWKFWIMDNYLAEFKKLGLVDWSPESKQLISIIEYPTSEQIKACLKRNLPYA